MKAIRYCLIFIICLLIACSKDVDLDPGNTTTVTPTDFRDQFAGTYECYRLCKYSDITGLNYTSYDSIYFLDVIKDPADSLRLIIDNIVSVELDSMNSFFDTYVGPYKFYSISFYNTDSVNLSTFSGGLGGGTSCTTKGRKM